MKTFLICIILLCVLFLLALYSGAVMSRRSEVSRMDDEELQVAAFMKQRDDPNNEYQRELDRREKDST